MIITIANAKGGVAKTTSAMYLAAAFTRRYDGSAAIVLDADPQSSASLWRDLAEDSGETLDMVDVRAANISTLQRLQDRPSGTLTIVDAPPQGRLLGSRRQGRRLRGRAHLRLAARPPAGMGHHGRDPAGKPSAVLIVRAETQTRAYEATVEALDAQGTPRFDSVVRKRQDVKAAMGHRPAKLHEYAQVLGELLEARA